MKVLYAQRCLGCHGTMGKGDGPVASSLPVSVPDFRDTVERKTVVQIRKVIAQGEGLMPAFSPALSHAEIQDSVRLVNLLSREGRPLKWWEKFEPLVWAHCRVPWEYVLGYDEAGENERPK
ncbi:MAG: cytochrome c [Deltaproteobacteria bacterium]|nr:cytochrome c [Deltaproteobacteria bacterium]